MNPHVLPPPGHRCSACGLAYDEIGLADAADRIRAALGAVRHALTPISEAQRRASTGDVWSVNEYVCHLRDVFVTSTIRLHRARTEHRPFLDPMFNDLRAKRFAYRELDGLLVMREAELASQGFLDEVDRLRPDELTRTARRQIGEERTALWFVQHAVHEAVHHAQDITARCCVS